MAEMAMQKGDGHISYEEWIGCNGEEVYRDWQFIHDEYGDAAPLLSAFKEQRYREAMQGKK